MKTCTHTETAHETVHLQCMAHENVFACRVYVNIFVGRIYTSCVISAGLISSLGWTDVIFLLL
jgi:hypothetical protein